MGLAMIFASVREEIPRSEDSARNDDRVECGCERGGCVENSGRGKITRACGPVAQRCCAPTWLRRQCDGRDPSAARYDLRMTDCGERRMWRRAAKDQSLYEARAKAHRQEGLCHWEAAARGVVKTCSVAQTGWTRRRGVGQKREPFAKYAQGKQGCRR
jgi:hypothetical protein